MKASQKLSFSAYLLAAMLLLIAAKHADSADDATAGSSANIQSSNGNPTGAPPEITSPLNLTTQVNQQFIYQFLANNATLLAVDPPLAPGLSFDTSLGAIVGTPTSGGIFQMTLRAMNAQFTTTATLTLRVEPVPAPTPTPNPTPTPTPTSTPGPTPTPSQQCTPTFAGTGLGNIPDGGSGTPPLFGPPLVISFAVSGRAAPLTSVSVDLTLTHTWVGDLDMVLTSPGGAASLVTVSRIGVTSAGSAGDSSNYSGLYNFTDIATGPNIWTIATAAACGDTCVVNNGNYRTTAPGAAGQTNPPPATSLNTTFGGLSTAQINGTWALVIRDAAAIDTGSVTAANLKLGQPCPTPLPSSTPVPSSTPSPSTPPPTPTPIPTMTPPILRIVSSASATARVGRPFVFQVLTTGASPAVRLVASGLPSGLTAGAATGLITGTPTSSGSFPVTLTVTDGNRSATSTLQLTFTANPALPVIVSSSSALLIPNQPFYYKLEADAADSSTTYRLLFALPNGLSFNPATREITGTYIVPLAPDRVFPNPPAQSGGIITNVQLFANNSNGTGTLPLIFFPAATGAVNIATRVAVGTGSEVLIGGFIVTGEAAAKKLLIRAIGPSLGDFGVPNPLQDPKLELRDGAGSLIASNDDWRSDQETQIIATTIAPTDNRESALLAYLSPEHSDTPNSGHYTAIVSGKNNGTGNALVEVYDLGTATLDSSTAKLANISTRGKVGINDDVMIGGFITSGTPTAVVARAIGPSLEPFGIVDPLADPSLELRDVNGVLIIRNDNWRGPQEQQLIDLGLAPTDNRESAVIATLNPGNYTGTVRGENNTTGVAVVEVYVLK